MSKAFEKSPKGIHWVIVRSGPRGGSNEFCTAIPGLRFAPAWAIFESSPREDSVPQAGYALA